jgi:hypothetical protein
MTRDIGSPPFLSHHYSAAYQLYNIKLYQLTPNKTQQV